MSDIQIDTNKKKQRTRLVLGINDLETWCKENDRPELLEQWNYEKNGGYAQGMSRNLVITRHIGNVQMDTAIKQEFPIELMQKVDVPYVRP